MYKQCPAESALPHFHVVGEQQLVLKSIKIWMSVGNVAVAEEVLTWPACLTD